MLQGLGEVLATDEHVLPLAPRLADLARDAMKLLTEVSPAPGAAPTPASPSPALADLASLPAAQPALHAAVVEEGQQLHLSGTAAEQALDELKARLARDRDLELTLSWRLQRKTTHP